jgi:hypothetical protein
MHLAQSGAWLGREPSSQPCDEVPVEAVATVEETWFSTLYAKEGEHGQQRLGWCARSPKQRQARLLSGRQHGRIESGDQGMCQGRSRAIDKHWVSFPVKVLGGSQVCLQAQDC